MRSLDSNGGTTDFFRGIGQVGATCEITNVYYITQDQNCVTQAGYSVIIRGLAAGNSGPDTTATLFNSGPLLTPPGPPGPCAWAINLALSRPAALPCDKSWFVGLALAAGVAADIQSIQAAYYTGNGAGEVAAIDAADFAWQIDAANVVSHCASARAWDFGVTTRAPTANAANIHGDPRCAVDPAPGVGGMYPSNSLRGDGIAIRVRDSAAFRPDGDPVLAFMSLSVMPAGIQLPGVISANPIWIGPSPFLQIAFGAVTIAGGEATLAPAFLGRARTVGLSGTVWFQGLIVRSGLPYPMTNAVAVRLHPTN